MENKEIQRLGEEYKKHISTDKNRSTLRRLFTAYDFEEIIDYVFDAAASGYKDALKEKEDGLFD